jgi:peptide/nickel transport system permease protein
MSPSYVVRQLLATVPLLLGISVVLFGILHLAPGGPLDIYADNPSVTPEALAHMRHAYGLDQPLPLQYLMWLKAVAGGNWGFSIRSGRPVIDEILARLPATLLLGGCAMLLSLLIALPVGLLTAWYRGRAADHLLTFAALSGISVPVFWLALMMQLVFSIMLGWLPPAGYDRIGDASLATRAAHLVMPACVLSLATAASWSRFLRSSLLDVLQQDYIRTAWAKGQTLAGVLLRHALRNALVPVVTVVALDLASIISGAIITETVFAWPGIGRLFVESMEGRDYPVLMGLMMFGSVALVLANLFADLAYALIDPRIRFR